MSEWVGLDGVNGDGNLIQAGIDEKLNPSTGLFSITPWWEILPATEQPINMDVSVGDQITVEVWQIGGTTWGIQLTDETTGQAFSTSQQYYGEGNTVDYVVEAPTDPATGGVYELADYTPAVSFTNLRFNGTQSSLVEDILVQQGVQVSTPSSLTSSGFDVNYGADAPSQP